VRKKREKKKNKGPEKEFSFNLRLADVHDILPMTLMWSKMVEESGGGYDKIDKEELDKFSYAMMDRLRIPNVFTNLGEVDGRIVGFIHAYIQNKPYGKPSQVAFCECLYVDKKYRGKGLNDALAESYIAWSWEQGSKISLEMMTRYDIKLVKVWAKKHNFFPYNIVFRRD